MHRYICRYLYMHRCITTIKTASCQPATYGHPHTHSPFVFFPIHVGNPSVALVRVSGDSVSPSPAAVPAAQSPTSAHPSNNGSGGSGAVMGYFAVRIGGLEDPRAPRIGAMMRRASRRSGIPPGVRLAEPRRRVNLRGFRGWEKSRAHP